MALMIENEINDIVRNYFLKKSKSHSNLSKEEVELIVNKIKFVGKLTPPNDYITITLMLWLSELQFQARIERELKKILSKSLKTTVFLEIYYSLYKNLEPVHLNEKIIQLIPERIGIEYIKIISILGGYDISIPNEDIGIDIFIDKLYERKNRKLNNVDRIGIILKMLKNDRFENFLSNIIYENILNKQFNLNTNYPIFLVFITYNNESELISISESSIKLNCNAYWIRLKSDNNIDVLKKPSYEAFNVDNLNKIFKMIGD